jgi:hypothetical protein
LYGVQLRGPALAEALRECLAVSPHRDAGVPQGTGSAPLPADVGAVPKALPRASLGDRSVLLDTVSAPSRGSGGALPEALSSTSHGAVGTVPTPSRSDGRDLVEALLASPARLSWEPGSVGTVRGGARELGEALCSETPEGACFRYSVVHWRASWISPSQLSSKALPACVPVLLYCIHVLLYCMTLLLYCMDVYCHACLYCWSVFLLLCECPLSQSNDLGFLPIWIIFPCPFCQKSA